MGDPTKQPSICSAQLPAARAPPIILVGTEFWSGMIDWIKKSLLSENKNISKSDLDLFITVDTKEEVIDILEEFHKNYVFTPNF